VSTPFVTRFAPSPSGPLHRGHAYSALKAHEAAKAAGGRFILRIEDIDTARCRPEHEAAILEDLAWLGLEWEQPVRRQSEHLEEYQAALDGLRDRGLLYRCFRTRRDVLDEIARAPHGPMDAFKAGPLSDKEEERLLAEDRPYAWRLSLAAARKATGGFAHLTFTEEGEGPEGETGLIKVRPELTGDVVLGRKDVGVAYHLAVVMDDALQGITHVIRGEDLFEATHIQRVLQALLGFPEPTYRHHRLLVGPDGKRFAKRDKAQSLRELRAGGMTPDQLRGELGFT
jgi:glutamyl-Q tRNA(Asp) synthetase